MNEADVEALSSGERMSMVKVVDPVDRYTAIAVRFAKFSNASQIPEDYLRKELTMKGKVREIVPDGILKIEHEPLIKLPTILRRPLHVFAGFIDVRLAGLDISAAGLEYLSKDIGLLNKNVQFTVIKHGSSNFVDAEVLIKKNFFHQTNLNIDLVRRGYAKVLALDQREHYKALQSVPAYSRLISKLIMSEKIADIRGIGIWKRDTWVESLAAYPSQIIHIIKFSAITQLAVLLFIIARDMFYGQFAKYVEKLFQLYNNTKRKLIK
ncbi:unnamed protein product [Dracunculus medinensis]|uniref:Recep_L_domain domain-containing protein n=1 Tax=Dracunculus medinensis TaxID=318479 RepID=A0A0N4UKN7_DRAME|nr:unnamed protein product [Dracunculus medinensis]